MDSRRCSPFTTPITPAAVPLLPAWATSRHHDMSEADAAFAAGINLKSLDDLVRAEPVWAGCWRQRLALRCAQAAVHLIGRNEGEAGLRDALLLTAPGDDPGSAGAIVLAFHKLAGKTRPVGTKVDGSAGNVVSHCDEGLEALTIAGLRMTIATCDDCPDQGSAHSPL